LKMSIPLTEQILASMKVAKIHNNHTRRITCIDIDWSGKRCVSVGEDEALNLYDCETGKHTKGLFSKKYGIDLVRFVNKTNCVLYASTKVDDNLRYLSLHDNQYLRYFAGHKNKVVSLDLNPLDDQFISGAVDDTVRLWDVRSPNCVGSLSITGRPVVAFDPKGLIFAVGLESKTLKLYDTSGFDKGPFSTFVIEDRDRRNVEWASLKFSNDGDNILITTRQEVIYVVDAFSGQVKKQLTGHVNTSGLKIEASFTPDAQFVVSGSQDGNVHIWNTETGQSICVLEGHPSPVTSVKFNPHFMTMVSACHQLAFWLPADPAY